MGVLCALAETAESANAMAATTGTASQFDEWRPGASGRARVDLDDSKGSGLQDFESDGLIDQFYGNSSADRPAGTAISG